MFVDNRVALLGILIISGVALLYALNGATDSAEAPKWEIRIIRPYLTDFRTDLNAIGARGEIKFRATLVHSFCHLDNPDPHVEISRNTIRISLLTPSDNCLCKCLFPISMEGRVWNLPPGEYNVVIGWRSNKGTFGAVKSVIVHVP